MASRRIAAALAVLLPTACSSSDASGPPGGAGGAIAADAAADRAADGSSGVGGAGASAAMGGSAGASGGTGGLAGSSLAGAGGGPAGGAAGSPVGDAGVPDVRFTYDAEPPPEDACALTTVRAEQIPLDMYVMMDISGSMLDTTSSGATKWDGMKQAFTAFVQDPKSAGLGVGIQYFAQRAPGVPAQCTASAQCGTGGPCVLRSCANNINAICETNANCFPFQCVPRGVCSHDPNTVCIPVGGTACGAGNSCNAITTSHCLNQESCVPAAYATPAVNIAPLPGNQSALVTSLAAQTPFAATPTGPALQGAIDHARTWAAANPAHKVVVLLATDGLPTRCTPTNINQVAGIAQAGFAGTPQVLTFVLGIFSPAEAAQAQANLNTIASQGGTNAAFVVDTSGNVVQALTDALDTIRGSALSCEYLMPETDAGIVDLDQVDVLFDDGATRQTLTRVNDGTGCGAGWHYDDNLSPTRITLCPSTCTAVQAATTGSIDIELGCLGS